MAENLDWLRLGVAPEWAAAFGVVAARRAPRLAQHYAQSLRTAYHQAGLPPLTALPWRTPWPAGFGGPIPPEVALASARAAMFDLHLSLGLAVGRLVAAAAVRWGDSAGRTRMRAFGPPQVDAPNGQTPAAAVTLAHELGHGVQMLTPRGFSRKSPALGPAEAMSQICERAATRHLRVYAPAAMAAQEREDLLAMLVRHPARAAFEARGTGWPDMADAYAAALDWRGAAPQPHRTPGALTAYALTAALSWVAEARLAGGGVRNDRFAAWALSGPQARLCDLAAILDADLADPALYDTAYDHADRIMTGPFP